METVLPARQDAQQPEHLAVSKGISCGLYPLGLPQALRWASLGNFYNRDCQSKPLQQGHHDQGQLAASYGGLTFMCPI